MKTILRPLFCLIPFLIVVANLFAIPNPSKGSPVREFPPLEEIEIPTPAYQRYLEVADETKRLLKVGDTAGMEAMARQLRESKEALDGGTWMLSHFYANAVSVPRKVPAEEEKAMAFYRDWSAKSPNSITAQICLAQALSSYAWNARGSGYTGTVTDDGWKLFRERLEESWQVLQAARNLEETCPAWYSAAQTVALGQGWDHDRYFQMVDEALAKEPTYFKYHASVCYYLFPRWHGEPGDLEKWIETQANRYAEGENDRQYARLVWMLDTLGFEEEIVFGPGRLDWERTRKGFDFWLKEKPDNLMLQFEFLRLALLAEDRETARQQFESTKGKYWPNLWGENKEMFKSAREFAYGNGKNPLRADKPKKSKRLSPEAAERVGTIFRLMSGFFGGVLGGGLCLILALQYRRTAIGIAALVGSVVLGTFFSTWAAGILALILVVWLLRKSIPEPADAVRIPSPGMALLWLVLATGGNMVLQIVATVLVGIAISAADGGSPENIEKHFEQLNRSGEIFRIVLNAGWISLLFLWVVCETTSRGGFRALLGLFPCRSERALKFLLPSGLALALFGWGLEFFEDAKTREAMEMMASGVLDPVPFVVAVVLVIPVFEELLFRGFFYQAWVSRWGVFATSFLGSVIFTLCHIQYGWVGLLYVLILSLTFYFLRWKTGSVIPPLILHVLNNGVSVAMILADSSR